MNRHLPEGAVMLWLLNEAGGLPFNLASVRSHRALTGGAQPTGTNVGVNGSASWRATTRGPGVEFATTSANLQIGNVDDLTFLTREVTALIGWEKTDTTNRASSAWGYSGVLNKRLHSHMPFSDGTVYFDFGGQTSGSTRLAVAGLTVTGYNTWGFSVGRGMQMWQAQNGLHARLVGSNAATPTRDAGAQNSGFHLNQPSSGGDLAICHWFFLHRLQLSGEHVRAILAAPFGELVEPLPRRTINLAPGWPRRINFIPGLYGAWPGGV
jgi:hypothetical protein